MSPGANLSNHRDFRPAPKRQHAAFRGLPRAVNNIATLALVAAMAECKNIVDEQSARTAISETTSD